MSGFELKPLEQDGGQEVELLGQIAGNTVANQQQSQDISSLLAEAQSINGHADAIETATAAAQATLGATTGAKVITDADGTIQQYLRGLVHLIISKIWVKAWFNTAKDGSGTDYQPIVDADGHQQVDVVAELPAGTQLIGKVGIDQTTDGTTNKVYVGNATHAYSLTETAVNEASITASGDSGTLPGVYGQYGEVYALLNCGTVTGTAPTLDVKIQASVDGTTWTDIVSFAQLTGSAQSSVKVISRYYAADAQKAIANKLKVVWTIGGTDTPTFGTVTVKWTCKR